MKVKWISMNLGIDDILRSRELEIFLGEVGYFSISCLNIKIHIEVKI